MRPIELFLAPDEGAVWAHRYTLTRFGRRKALITQRINREWRFVWIGLCAAVGMGLMLFATGGWLIQLIAIPLILIALLEVMWSWTFISNRQRLGELDEIEFLLTDRRLIVKNRNWDEVDSLGLDIIRGVTLSHNRLHLQIEPDDPHSMRAEDTRVEINDLANPTEALEIFELTLAAYRSQEA